MLWYNNHCELYPQQIYYTIKWIYPRLHVYTLNNSVVYCTVLCCAVYLKPEMKTGHTTVRWRIYWITWLAWTFWESKYILDTLRYVCIVSKNRLLSVNLLFNDILFFFSLFNPSFFSIYWTSISHFDVSNSFVFDYILNFISQMTGKKKRKKNYAAIS